MSSKVVSTAQQTLHFFSKSPKNPIPDHSSTLSFTSHLTKSKIPEISPNGPLRARRGPIRVVSFYAPAAETAETLYEVLGITESGSTTSDIKTAYKQMARKYHPDVSPPDRVDEYTRRFILVHEAYETLSNPQSRASYDRDLATGFGFASGISRRRHQEIKRKDEWKSRWESQLEELKQRDFRTRPTWGARMRNQT